MNCKRNCYPVIPWDSVPQSFIYPNTNINISSNCPCRHWWRFSHPVTFVRSKFRDGTRVNSNSSLVASGRRATKEGGNVALFQSRTFSGRTMFRNKVFAICRLTNRSLLNYPLRYSFENAPNVKIKGNKTSAVHRRKHCWLYKKCSVNAFLMRKSGNSNDKHQNSHRSEEDSLESQESNDWKQLLLSLKPSVN